MRVGGCVVVSRFPANNRRGFPVSLTASDLSKPYGQQPAFALAALTSLVFSVACVRLAEKLPSPPPPHAGTPQ